jgi:hypothetical protein
MTLSHLWFMLPVLPYIYLNVNGAAHFAGFVSH